MSRFITKALSVALCLCLIIGLFITPTTVYAQSLNDIENSWAKEEIQEWLERGLVTGYLDNTFRPQDNITRAEFVAIINRTFGFTKMDLEMFSDVDPNIWYYKEVSIAKAAGYISGYIGNKFKPESNIKRQEVSAILFRLLKLSNDGDISELEQFNDYNNIQLWSKVYLNEVVKEGYITGYPDLTFRPEKAITRQETVAILDRVVGKYINESGNYGPEEGKEVVEGNLTINRDDVVLKNTTIKGNLYLAAGIGEGDVELDNVTVEGRTIISGGGENSITFANSTVGEMVVIKIGGKIRVVAKGSTVIGETKIESDTKLEEEGLEGEGFGEIIVLKEGQTLEIDGDFETVTIEADGVTVAVDEESNVESLVVKSDASISSEGTIENVTIDAKDKTVELSGEFTEVNVGSSSNVEVIEGSKVEQIEVTEEANGADITLQEGSEVESLTINATIEVSGEGSIESAEINAEDVYIQQDVNEVVLGEGIETVVVGGESTGGDTEPSGGTSTGGLSPGGGTGGTVTPQVPDASLSGITNQVMGSNGSRKVTLTISIKDEDGKGLANYSEKDFSFKHSTEPAATFKESFCFSNFINIGEGEYSVDYFRYNGARVKIYDLTVDSVIIEEESSTINFPEALANIISPEYCEEIMADKITGTTNADSGTVVTGAYIAIKDIYDMYFDYDGNLIETEIWLPVTNTGTNYSTWEFQVPENLLEAINECADTRSYYTLDLKIIRGDNEDVIQSAAGLTIHKQILGLEENQQVVAYISNRYLSIDVVESTTIEELLQAVVILKNDERLYVSNNDCEEILQLNEEVDETMYLTVSGNPCYSYYRINIVENVDAVPYADYSGITNQVIDPNESGKVTLTISVKDKNNQGLVIYNKEDFKVRFGTEPAYDFNDNKYFSNFINNEDGTYNVDFTGCQGEEYDIEYLTVDNFIIEKGCRINTILDEPYKYGVVVDVADGIVNKDVWGEIALVLPPQIKILTDKGQEVIHELYYNIDGVTSNASINGTELISVEGLDIPTGTFITYEVNSDNEIIDITYIEEGTFIDDSLTVAAIAEASYNDPILANEYIITDDSILFDVTSTDSISIYSYLPTTVGGIMVYDYNNKVVAISIDNADGEMVEVSGIVTTMGAITYLKLDDQSVVTFQGITSEDIIYNGAQTTKNSSDITTGSAVTIIYNHDKTVIIKLQVEEITSIEQIDTPYNSDNNFDKIGSTTLPTIDTNQDGIDDEVDINNIIITGDATSLEEIATKDIVYSYIAEDNSIVKLIVVRDSIKGVVEEIKISSVIASGAELFSGAFDVTELELGTEYIFYLDKDEKVFSIEFQQIIDYAYGIVVGVKDGVITNGVWGEEELISHPLVKILTSSGEELIYVLYYDISGVISNASINGEELQSVDGLDIPTGTFVTYILNSDGEVIKINYIIEGTFIDSGLTVAAISEAGFIAPVLAETYIVTDNSILFDVTSTSSIERLRNLPTTCGGILVYNSDNEIVAFSVVSKTEVPYVEFSGITDYTTGLNGSYMSTLTIEVRDSNNYGLVNYEVEDFSVTFGTSNVVYFNQEGIFENFINNRDGTYNIDYYTGCICTTKLYKLTVDSIQIEEESMPIIMPLPLITTPLHGFEEFDYMLSKITGVVNQNEGITTESVSISILDDRWLYLDSDGTWTEDEVWYQVENTGVEFDTWEFNFNETLLNSLNTSYGRYIIDARIETNDSSDTFSYLTEIKINSIHPSLQIKDSEIVEILLDDYLQFDVKEGSSVLELIQSIEIIKNVDDIYVVDENYNMVSNDTIVTDDMYLAVESRGFKYYYRNLVR